MAWRAPWMLEGSPPRQATPRHPTGRCVQQDGPSWEVPMLTIKVPGAVVAILAAALAAPTAFGQQATPSSPAPTPAPPPAGGAPAPPAEAGRLQRTHGGWRSSQ